MLVIDDNREVREFVHRHIESADMCVRSADGADEALDVLREEKTPQLILLDAAMPGVDGFQLCKILKQNRDLAAVPIVLMARTGDRQPNIREVISGFTDTLAKPISPASLRAIVAKYCPNADPRDGEESSWPELPEEAVR